MPTQVAGWGPIHGIALSTLKSRPEYQRFRDGRLSRSQFSRFLDQIGPELVAAGLPPEDVHFAKRYPRSESAFVDRTMHKLAARAILTDTAYDSRLYEALATKMRTDYEHGPFHTYIYPEESRLLFAIADIVKPRSTVFLGSYYGYWAYPAIATIAAHGGRVVLVDPDPVAQSVAAQNMKRASFCDAVTIVTASGEAYLDSIDTSFDFVVLDAEGPRDHSDPEQRGKAVYGPLLRHALPHMPSGSCLVCHNILFRDICDCSFFSGIIARNKHELASFLTILREEFPDFAECESTEGVGVGRRRVRA